MNYSNLKDFALEAAWKWPCAWLLVAFMGASTWENSGDFIEMVAAFVVFSVLIAGVIALVLTPFEHFNH